MSRHLECHRRNRVIRIGTGRLSLPDSAVIPLWAGVSRCSAVVAAQTCSSALPATASSVCRGSSHSTDAPTDRAREATGAELIKLALRQFVIIFCLFTFRPEEQVGQRVEPGLVSLPGWCCEDDLSTWSNDNQGFTVKARWVRIVIGNDSDRFNSHTLRFEHVLTSCARVLLAPVQGSGVWVDPEEASVSC